jgi:hypothetical protein
MGRPPDGAQTRTLTVHLRITPRGLAHLNAACGDRTRSAYIRDLIAADVARRRIQPKDT